MHYDSAGNVDRWGSKYEQLIFPLLIIGICAFWQCFISHFQKKSDRLGDSREGQEAAANVKLLKLVAMGQTLMFSVMHFVLLYTASLQVRIGADGHLMDFPALCNFLLGLFLIVIGNDLPRSKPNGVVGFRTGRTMSDEEVWKKSNHAAGCALIIVGVLSLLSSLLLDGMIATFLTVGLLLLMTVGLQIYTMKL